MQVELASGLLNTLLVLREIFGLDIKSEMVAGVRGGMDGVELDYSRLQVHGSGGR